MKEKQTYSSTYTLEEIAISLGVTGESVRQIERTVRKKLKSPKVSRKPQEYPEQ